MNLILEKYDVWREKGISPTTLSILFPSPHNLNPEVFLVSVNKLRLKVVCNDKFCNRIFPSLGKVGKRSLLKSDRFWCLCRRRGKDALRLGHGCLVWEIGNICPERLRITRRLRPPTQDDPPMNWVSYPLPLPLYHTVSSDEPWINIIPTLACR